MELNHYIDHTNLKAYAKEEDIRKLCEEAKAYHFASVCVHPYYVSLAHHLLEDTDVAVGTVIGFPLGQNKTSIKVEEAKLAIEDGASELDMVINLAALKDGNDSYVKEEITKLREVTQGYILKVIIETCYLTEEEIVKMTEICNETGVDFIKTSTGFGIGGATVEDVCLLNDHRNDFLQIKASGGIQTKEVASQLIKMGASRIGTSHGITIVEGKKEE